VSSTDHFEDFFANRPNLRCPKLNGRILRLYCFKRMIAAKPGKGTYGSKRPDNPLDAYCRSGLCPCGLETVRILGLEKEYANWRDGPQKVGKTDDVQKSPSKKTKR